MGRSWRSSTVFGEAGMVTGGEPRSAAEDCCGNKRRQRRSTAAKFRASLLTYAYRGRSRRGGGLSEKSRKATCVNDCGDRRARLDIDPRRRCTLHHTVIRLDRSRRVLWRGFRGSELVKA